ncbi:LytR/AlgR family response regulator transcription factor [uncultured Allomuricauda sp.]|uniref:LytR/AlgR family response regulator transcription factor n=1 Tax=Flagellimonas sp. W118 TaxID=3410791 RepID=UPI00260460A4|nr:LytTR family DNA-binding domain-containing protein [uncultured Allomuricauda sp.]
MDVYTNNVDDKGRFASQIMSTFDSFNRALVERMDFTCLIIDDEALARKRVRRLLAEAENVKLLDECSNGESAIQKINALNPDFIFLDIKMKDMTGFDVLKQLDQTKIPLPILISAYDDFAIRAFDFKAFDFLLKPFNKVRFYECLNRVQGHLKILKYRNNAIHFNQIITEIDSKIERLNVKPLDKIPVKLGNKTIFVPTNDILYFLASGSYSELYQKDKKVVLRDSLTNIFRSLDKTKFIRIHRSTIINRDYIIEIQASSYYEIDVIMPKNRKFRVSKSYRNATMQKLGL